MLQLRPHTVAQFPLLLLLALAARLIQLLRAEDGFPWLAAAPFIMRCLCDGAERLEAFGVEQLLRVAAEEDAVCRPLGAALLTIFVLNRSVLGAWQNSL